MRQEEALLIEVYSDLIEGFGVNHSRVYFSLLSSEVKTAKQVIDETDVCKATVYSVLKDLIECELIGCTNSNPRSYYLVDPIKSFNRKVEQKRKHLLKRLKKLEKVIESSDSEETKEFVIKIGKGNQTKIINVQTKEQLCSRQDALKVKHQIEQFIRKMPTKQNNNSLSGYSQFI